VLAARRRSSLPAFPRAVLAVLAACVAVLSDAAPSAAAAPPGRHRALVERVEWEMSDAGASVIVVVKGRVDYQSRFAPADATTGLPPRAYVDLHPAQLGDQVSREPLIVDDRLVRRIRLGQFDKDTVRVVLDLSRPARLRVETRDRPSRLMLRLARGASDGAVAGAEDGLPPQPSSDVARTEEAAAAQRAARRREAELAQREQALAEERARQREAELARKEQALAEERARQREAELAERARAEADERAARQREAELAERARAEADERAARQREAELAERARAEADERAARQREADLAQRARAQAEERAARRQADRVRAEAEERARREQAEIARSGEPPRAEEPPPVEQALLRSRNELEPSRGWDDDRLALRPRSELAPAEGPEEEPLAPQPGTERARSDEAEERPRPTPGGAARSPPLFLSEWGEKPGFPARPGPSPPSFASALLPLATARPLPTVRPTPPHGPTAVPKTVVIDPGHGGKDPGAEGAFGVPEKDVTLALAYLIKDNLEEEGGVRVVLTRTDDRYVSLEERTATANAQGAELFVSIHANASESENLSGIETYTLNNTDDRATIRLAALENGLTLAGATPGEQDLAYILSDLVQTGKEDESVLLARAVQNELVRYLRGRWKSVSDLGVKKGPFYVLVGAYMPCVLVEAGFLTHPVEGPRMATHRYQRDIAQGVADGIRRFLAAPPPGANL
jgi:N-acetylmuramoyl-L-alanine amidase